MRIEEGTVIGSLRVTDAYVLQGTVTGDAVVGREGDLEVDGAVAGSVRVEAGGRASIMGTVAGDVHNAGTLSIRGVVLGRLTSEPGAWTTIERFAQVDGVTY